MVHAFAAGGLLAVEFVGVKRCLALLDHRRFLRLGLGPFDVFVRASRRYAEHRDHGDCGESFQPFHHVGPSTRPDMASSFATEPCGLPWRAPAANMSGQKGFTHMTESSSPPSDGVDRRTFIASAATAPALVQT